MRLAKYHVEKLEITGGMSLEKPTLGNIKDKHIVEKFVIYLVVVIIKNICCEKFESNWVSVILHWRLESCRN